jgi:hypothetical protein
MGAIRMGRAPACQRLLGVEYRLSKLFRKPGLAYLRTALFPPTRRELRVRRSDPVVEFFPNGELPVRSRRSGRHVSFVAVDLLLVVLAVTACQGSPSPAPSVSFDLLLQRVEEDINQSQNNATMSAPELTALPPAFREYLADQLIAPRVVAQNRPLVADVCKLLEVPVADRIVEAGLTKLLERLHASPGEIGIGLLAGAMTKLADYGCKKAVVQYLSTHIQLTELHPRVTVLPSQSPIIMDLKQPITIRRDGVPTFEVSVGDVRCQWDRLGSYRPAGGDVFIGAQVTLEGLVDGASYDESHWGLEVDDQEQNAAINDSSDWPALGWGTLSRGESVTGWVSFITPIPVRTITVIYRSRPLPSAAPVFVVNRTTCNPIGS